jgi:hypothetical protein
MAGAPVYKCPVCGSTDVRRGKTSLSGPQGGQLIDFYCQSCRTFEHKRDDEDGYDAWYRRWLAPPKD